MQIKSVRVVGKVLVQTKPSGFDWNSNYDCGLITEQVTIGRDRGQVSDPTITAAYNRGTIDN